MTQLQTRGEPVADDTAPASPAVDEPSPLLPSDGARRVREATGAVPRRLHRQRRRIGTALRLAAFQASVLAVVLAVVVVALVHQVSTSYQSIAASTLTAQLRSYAAAAEQRSIGSAAGLFAFSHTYLQGHSLPSGVQLVFDIPGQGAVGSSGTRAILANRSLAHSLTTVPATSHLEVTRIAGSDAEVLSAPIEVGGRVLGTFVATASLAALEQQRARMIELSIAEAAVALAAGALSAYLLLRRLLRTVGKITTAAEEIHEGDLEKRLGDQGTDDEVSHLAATFDAMLDRLSGVMGSQRRLLSDVSHQLRTPLTVARGHLEVLTRAGCGDPASTADTVGLVLDELGHMSTLVDSLLLLGRAIEPDFLQREPLDLRDFVADLYEAVTVLAEREWTITSVPDVVLCVDAAKLRGALLNVVDNAIKATRPHDVIALSAELSPDRRTVLLTIDDQGPGIPSEQRRAVLERFTRLPGQRAPGTGLGLAIVDAVATAHGGRVEITTSVLGGARVGIRLPAVPWRPEDGLP